MGTTDKDEELNASIFLTMALLKLGGRLNVKLPPEAPWGMEDDISIEQSPSPDGIQIWLEVNGVPLDKS